ncbi:glutathione S-transferase family protein [Sphingopyxis sp. MWB1]|uniref:glutathione S-transferase family protein n=1 Tax=Sphingopyxis sp. MWB1 TaxID=1537715 RepID=UPI00051A8AF2|nr:glutathione S-transferase N-terminal domain-containing protein [Sphingopyxis sp. MWB1]
MIRLYGTPLSGNAHKVRLALTFLGFEEKTAWEEVPTDAAIRASSDYRALNPMGQIPLYREDDFTLRDSQAILAYLAARHRPGDWDGRDPQERGEINVWLSHAANEIQNGPAALRLERLFDAPIDQAQALAITEKFLPVIDAHLAQRHWLVGDRLTIADMAASPYLALIGDAGLDPARWPHVAAWTRRIAALPGFRAMPGWDAA